MAKTFLRNKSRIHEPIWHAQLAMLLAIGLQLVLPDKYVLGSRYFLVTTEALLILAMSLTHPKERIIRSLTRRFNVILLLFITGIANVYSLIIIAQQLLGSSKITNGRELILSAINIYITNLIVFGLLYWEMDAGGPVERPKASKLDYDFMFVQASNPSFEAASWRPTFVDYLYVSGTNGMAFSPTDTMPLSRRAKLLMLAQATISLIAIGLVAARAVNILG